MTTQVTSGQPDGVVEKVISLCKRRGFVYPNSEIYGGVAGIYDFGPLGAEMRRNLRDHWWRCMVRMNDDVVGIEGAIITHPRVWEASGHVENFSDPMVDCYQCRRRFRADHLAEAGGGMVPENCPECGGQLTQPRRFNLLMETELGVIEGDRQRTYLRGEACQTIYLDWLNVLQSSRLSIPFGIAQIGKAFRNEVTLGPFLLRLREFEQWDLQFFTHPNDMDHQFERWLDARATWCRSLLRHPERLRLRSHAQDELAFYASRATDIEFQVPGLGWKEWEGIHWRGDWDLRRHSEFSGQNLDYTDPISGERYIPWIVETSGGVDRTFFFLLVDAYDEEETSSGLRTVLRLPACIAPIKVALLPLSKKPELCEIAHTLHRQLARHFAVQYDETQSIGRRYRRQDEIGTPFCVTVDFMSLEDGQVTVRERDTMMQQRLPIANLLSFMFEQFA